MKPRGRGARMIAVALGLAAATMAPAGARTLAEIRQSGELRICVAGSSAAFYQTNAESFARTIGVAPQVMRLGDWDRQFQNAAGITVKADSYEAYPLASGVCDLYPNDLHMLDWRRSKMLLVPYYSTRKVVVAHRDMRQTLKREADLAGRRAAVQKGTAYESWLQQMNETSFKADPVAIELLPTAESMRQVSAGKADFSVIGAEGAFKWVRGELDNLDLLFPVDERVEVGWGISPAADDLRRALEDFFAANLRVGSDLDRAWQKQYGISRMEYQLLEASFETQKTDFRFLLALALPLGTGLIGALLAMLFWTRRLKREIAEHQRTEDALRASQELIARESARRLALTEISLHLQQATTEEAFGRVLLFDLSHHLPLAQAIFCRCDDAETHMPRAVAQYAGAEATTAATLARWSGDGGFVERCLDTRQPVLIEQPAANYLRVRTGTLDGAPAVLLLYPVCQLGRVCALLELALLQPLAPEQRQLLDDLAPLLALSLDRLAPTGAP